MIIDFLYKFTAGSSTYRYTKGAFPVEYNGEVYDSQDEQVKITHTAPTWSNQPEDSEIDVTIKEAVELAELLLTPPPFPIILDIFEYDHDSETVLTHYYRGWVVRCQFSLTQSLIVLHLKTVWHFFERESLTDSLSALSRYSIYDPRSGVDFSALGVAVTVTALNNERDRLTVTGITQPVDWFKGGFIEAPNLDKRTILADVEEVSERRLYLNGGFPQFTLSAGFNATIYPGDDLTYATWANKFSSLTNNGEYWGGWEYTPNVNPAVRGVA